MKSRFWVLIVIIGLLLQRTGWAAPPVRISQATDTYFMEDDQAYARFFWFKPGGIYSQINTDRNGSEEVDRGTWEQAPRGEVVLHPVNGMLVFRAVSAGPLFVMLNTQDQIDSLPVLIRLIATFLSNYQDLVFSRDALADVSIATNFPQQSKDSELARVILRETTDTFNRSELEDLLQQLSQWETNRSTNTATFDLVDISPAPPLLIQRGAVFSLERLAQVRSVYRVARNVPPPFYFGRVGSRIFRARAGAWKPFANLGGMPADATLRKPAR